MTEKEEYLFQHSNSCWICKKLIDNADEKVRDHCQITGKYRGSDHWDCNIKFQLIKKIPVIFYNLKGYDSHLIFARGILVVSTFSFYFYSLYFLVLFKYFQRNLENCHRKNTRF